MPLEPTPPHRDVSYSYLFFAHHWPSESARCTSVFGHHVCRRCSILWPTALISSVLFSFIDLSSLQSAVLIAILCVPATLEFCLENLRLTAHEPKRLIALSALLGIGTGIAFARYFENVLDPVFWIEGGTLVAIATLCALFGTRLRPLKR